jgi:acyl carrier protein
MEIEQKVREILLDILEISKSELDFDKEIRGSLGASSIEIVEIVAELENQFDIDISETDLENLMTPNDIVNYLAKQTKG